MPATMKAVVVTARGKTELKDVPVPSPAAGEILVKTSAIAVNPTDFSDRDFLAPEGSWLGCDYAGIVDKVGSGVTNVKEGDRVAGFVHGGAWEGEGWAEYIKAQASLVWKVPDNLNDLEAAAAAGVGPWTIVQAFYFRLGLNTPQDPVKEPEPVLIWGGSTSTGLYAIQFAKASGYLPIVTASEKNFDKLKALGAAATYSYSDADVASKIAKDFPKLRYALDTISEGKTTITAVKAIAQAAGKGKVVTLLGNQDPELKEYADSVPAEPTLLYTVLGVPFEWPGMKFPAMPEDKRRMEEWCANHLTGLFESGTIKPNPILPFEGGLANVQEGMDYLKAGKQSAQKVVYKV
ncbi:hypothetical protein JCM9279_006228 [Rhodotorula babjevae]